MGEDVGHPAARFLRGVLACPRCGNDVLEATSDGYDTFFLCQQCWTCWHWDVGYMVPVSGRTCGGCHHRDECLRRLEAEESVAGERAAAAERPPKA